MKKIHGLLISLLFLMTACSSQAPLKLSTTTWIGYTPLFYAKEKGWLNDINIKLVNVVSLSENMYLYQAGNSDAYCGTQYEHSVLKNKIPSLVPIMLFDRSNGGDIIMSNTSIEALQNSNESIDTYLEMDSINFTLLNDFIKRYDINEKRINYINRDQIEISRLKNDTPEQQTLIVTYIPYDGMLAKNGFKEILSTKNGLDLLVVDALFTTKETLIEHREQFVQLKSYVNDALAALQKDPQEFYQTVKAYMNEQSYEEFQHSLKDIEWINADVSNELMERMREASFPTKDLL